MSQAQDPFEDRLAEQLLDLGDRALPRRTTDEAIVSAAIHARNRTSLLSPIVALVALIAVSGVVVVAQRPAPDPGLAITSPGVSTQPLPSRRAEPFAYSCGGQSFSPELFNEPEVNLRSVPAGAALATFIESGQGETVLPADGWRIVDMGDTRASFIARLDGDPPYAEAEAEFVEGEWAIVGYGQCRPMIALSGLNPATWTVAAGQEIDETTTAFLVDVTETTCTGGRSSEDRVREPLIVYERDAILVIFTVAPLQDGALECPDNPPTRLRIELTEPVGERQLLDGGALPWRDGRLPG